MLTAWDPFTDFNRVQRELERNFFGRRGVPAKAPVADFSPAIDIHEEKDALVVSAELPGVKREEIEISLDGDVLTLKGERKLEKDEQTKKYHRVERSYGSFVRYFQLPTTVDAEKIEAKLADGVLTLRLPKKEALKPKKIELKA